MPGAQGACRFYDGIRAGRGQKKFWLASPLFLSSPLFTFFSLRPSVAPGAHHSRVGGPAAQTHTHPPSPHRGHSKVPPPFLCACLSAPGAGRESAAPLSRRSPARLCEDRRPAPHIHAMGFSFRKLFDSLFGTREMRVSERGWRGVRGERGTGPIARPPARRGRKEGRLSTPGPRAQAHLGQASGHAHTRLCVRRGRGRAWRASVAPKGAGQRSGAARPGSARGAPADGEAREASSLSHDVSLFSILRSSCWAWTPRARPPSCTSSTSGRSCRRCRRSVRMMREGWREKGSWEVEVSPPPGAPLLHLSHLITAFFFLSLSLLSLIFYY